MKKLLAPTVLTLTLAACANTAPQPSIGDPPPPPIGNPHPGNLGDINLTISGRIANYNPALASRLKLSYDETTSMTTADISRNGDFSINIPRPSPAQLMSLKDTLSCGQLPVVYNDLTMTPSDTRFRPVSLYTDAVRPLPVWYATRPDYPNGQKEVSANYVYVDRDATITGSMRCSRWGITVVFNYDVSFKRGWNIGVTRIDRSQTDSTDVHNLTVEAWPSNLNWYINDVR